MNENEAREKKTILIVDDDPDYLYQYRVQLEAAGFDVVEAGGAEEAREALSKFCPALVVMDLMMEEEDTGFTLCYEIKKKHPDLPVVIISSVAAETGIDFDATTDEERSWIKADTFLAKPIRFEQLEKEIRRLL